MLLTTPEINQREIPYPENCIRGISDPYLVGSDGTVGVGLFQFDKAQIDGWINESINWEDDIQAIPFTFNQQKPDGTVQFKIGVAIIPRTLLDGYSNLPQVIGRLSYNRDQTNENRYHGNIRIIASVTPLSRKRIAAGLANLVSKVVPNPASISANS